MAQEEPKVKKLKHSVISDFIYSDSFQQLFSEHWHKYSNIKNQNLEIISKPFRICRITNFLGSEELMDEIKNELLDVKSRRHAIDLYQFEQTGNLTNVETENLKSLYQTFQTDLATWMERNTSIELNKKVSMSSSCYYDTDYLLCHDDNIRDRRIAFILYLSKNWTEADGGALDLFDTDDNGLPRNVVKSLFPEYNSLVFFEVTDNSYHQVAEVVAPDKSRWSINGWFHGPLREKNSPPRPEVEPNYIEPANTEVDLNEWIKQCYLAPEIVKEIQQDVEQDSFAFLSNFFKDDVHEKLSTDLASDAIVWQKVGPADTRNYEIADEDSLPELLTKFCNMFKSISMFRLLKNYTELDLVPEKDKNPRMVIELQRWTRGCYTLICDHSFANESGSDKKDDNESAVQATEETRDDSLDVAEKSSKDCEEKLIPANDDRHLEFDANSPISNKDEDEHDPDEVLRKLMRANECLDPKMQNLTWPSSLLKMENVATIRPRFRDTDDSDVSDIGDYLSDPMDCSTDRSEDGEQMDQSANVAEAGALDVIVQFHTKNVPEEDTIDYVDPEEQDAALIHVPAKENHFCLVYKTLSTCRLHKYVNHYCTGYYYNLICTYYEE